MCVLCVQVYTHGMLLHAKHVTHASFSSVFSFESSPVICTHAEVQWQHNLASTHHVLFENTRNELLPHDTLIVLPGHWYTYTV